MTSLRSVAAAFFTLMMVAIPVRSAETIVLSVSESGDTPTPTDNDFTRINDAVQSAVDGDTLVLQGIFDWTEANAAASWALGSDGVASGDDFYLDVPPLDDFTITSASLGDATIQGPGDLPGVDLEGVFDFTSESGGGTYENLTVSNLTILGFDLSIAMFHGGGPTTAFSGATVTNNFLGLPADEPGNFSLGSGEPFQNIGIHFAFGVNQTISNNVIEVPGDALADRSDPDPANHLTAATVAMQSNTSGGSVYEGLLIDGNEIRILNAQSADPEIIYGIWENAHGHTSNITVSNNRFLNLSAGNDPAANIQNAFRVTSHSSATTTVTYEGNEVRGANLGLAQLIGFGGQDFSAHEPVQVIGNTFLDNATAVLVRSKGSDVLRCNRFFGNGLAIGNEGVLSDADALENWFGCNAGPGFGACDAIDPNVDAAVWIEMGLSISDPSLNAGESAAVTADLKRDSGGGLASCAMPDGAEVDFGAANGSMAPPMATLAGGLASSTFTAGGVDGFATVAAVLDGEVAGLFATVEASATDLTVTKTDGLFEADAASTLAYVIVVTNDGPSNVAGAAVEDTLPAQLSGCTWTCTPMGGGACTANGAGDIDDEVDLPVGASVRYDLSCTFQPGAVGAVINNVAVTVPAGFTELDASDDTASDLTYDSAVVIFTDGFESGNVSAWTMVMP